METFQLMIMHDMVMQTVCYLTGIENAALESQTASKGRELGSSVRRSDEVSKKLAVIQQWCQWFAQPQAARFSRPDSAPLFEVEQVSLAFISVKCWLSGKARNSCAYF